MKPSDAHATNGWDLADVLPQYIQNMYAQLAQLVHTRVVDTAVLYPNPRPRQKFSLKFLAQSKLGRIIQEQTGVL